MSNRTSDMKINANFGIHKRANIYSRFRLYIKFFFSLSPRKTKKLKMMKSPKEREKKAKKMKRKS